jgi:hypothetical protein
MQCGKTASLFDHLVGNCEYPWWDREAEHPGGLHVDDQFIWLAA